MARRKSKETPAELRLKLLLMSSALLFVPMLFGSHSVFSGLKSALRLPGVALLGVGLLLMALHPWCSKRKAPQAAPAVTAALRAAPSADLPAPASTRERLTRWSPEVFAAIEWRRFEAVVEVLFAQAGFETRAQTHGADGEVDIWLHSRHAGGVAVGVVQCKHWQGKPVGVQQMREFLGVLAHHGLKRGTYATTSCFTTDALAFARANGINAQDGDALLQLIATRTPALPPNRPCAGFFALLQAAFALAGRCLTPRPLWAA